MRLLVAEQREQVYHHFTATLFHIEHVLFRVTCFMLSSLYWFHTDGHAQCSRMVLKLLWIECIANLNKMHQ